MPSRRHLVGLLSIALAWAASTRPAAGQVPRPEIHPTRAHAAPVIDGRLDDPAWQGSALELGPWHSYQPRFGDPAPYRTDVWVAFDGRALYFAFRCHDDQPRALRSGVRRRDAVAADDLVGIQLDPHNRRQAGLRMVVNPHGVQGDSVATVSSNDWAPDWVWESAGEPTAEGYTVEVAVPFESLVLPAGAEVRVPIWMWRTLPRLGIAVSWPELPAGRSAFDASATLVVPHVPSRPAREAIPSVNYSASQARDVGRALSPVLGRASVGVSGRWAIRPGVTLEGTINPDFSQVESDAHQVEVNQRYPLFYSEKRPFFMAGSSLFRVARTGHNPNLGIGVHTRRIVDPAWGLKATGTSGRSSFAALAAGDLAPGRLVAPGAAGANEQKWYGIARGQYALGAGNNVGVIVAGSELGGRSNFAAGWDVSSQISGHQRVSALALLTSTSLPGSAAARSGAAGIGYSYTSRRLFVEAGLEHYGRDFEMDTAFYGRTGFTRASALTEAYLYPNLRGLRRISVWAWTSAERDREAGRDGYELNGGTILSFARQGSFVLRVLSGREPWAGQAFDRQGLQAQASVKPAPWITLSSSWSRARGVYYQGHPAFGGMLHDATIGAVFEPVPRLSQTLRARRVAFDRHDGRRVYRVVAIDSRTTFQFTRALAARAVGQYDSGRQRVLIDTLMSYEVRPGTVMYAGYGALVERQAFADGGWSAGAGEYLTTKRGVFLKASYLWRF